ncbi:MAG: hypothetical protein U0M66_00785 [Bacilli bacterium]|nr:hypothetical protein [Bacilli bacterium]
MINLVKKENLNLGILETDFDVFADIVNTFSSDTIKKDCLADLDDYVIPEYFRNKITLVIQTNKMLIGYVTFEFKNNANVAQVEINKLYILDGFKNKNMEVLLIEGVIYIAGEVGSRNVVVTVDEHDAKMLSIYQALGFYEVGISEDGSVLSISVITAVATRRLNDKFRDIAPDAIDYKSLKLVKKIASGRSGNIYLTQDGRILKMFTSTSFTYVKDREETLKYIKGLDEPAVVKPKHLVYYDGVFVGYIMEYLPEGEALWTRSSSYSFEQKIDKIKAIEEVIKRLHNKHIYVCDLNPDNIFFDKEGKVKIIDCDAFVIKDNVINTETELKYRDPLNRIVSEKTDLYAFAITTLQLLIDVNIDKNANFEEIERIYNKNKNKLPESFKNYYDHLFKSKERYYLTDAYERYLDEMYNVDDTETAGKKSGKISMIILSFIFVAIAVIGYLVFRFSR